MHVRASSSTGTMPSTGVPRHHRLGQHPHSGGFSQPHVRFELGTGGEWSEVRHRTDVGARRVAMLRFEQRMKHPCPCCGYATLSELAAYEICRVCRWEDDGQDGDHADEVWGGPNRLLSLTEARRNFLEFGASDRRRLQHARKPLKDEPQVRIFALQAGGVVELSDAR